MLIKIVLLQSEGDPLFSKSEGDPLFSKSEGDPLFSKSEGDPLFSKSEGDPLFSKSEGDPLFSKSEGMYYSINVAILPSNMYDEVVPKRPAPAHCSQYLQLRLETKR